MVPDPGPGWFSFGNLWRDMRDRMSILFVSLPFSLMMIARLALPHQTKPDALASDNEVSFCARFKSSHLIDAYQPRSIGTPEPMNTFHQAP